MHCKSNKKLGEHILEVRNGEYITVQIKFKYLESILQMGQLTGRHTIEEKILENWLR